MRVKGTKHIGTVIKVKGVYEMRVRVKVPPPDAGGDDANLKRARAATKVASRWYGLEELEPPA